MHDTILNLGIDQQKGDPCYLNTTGSRGCFHLRQTWLWKELLDGSNHRGAVRQSKG